MKVKAAYLLSRPFLLDNSPYADGAFLDKPTGGFANLEAAKGFALENPIKIPNENIR